MIENKTPGLSEQPAVSIIIPVYNVERYLRDCLDSAMNQTLTNIEIVCINDGSTDNSRQILEEYVKIDRRMLVFDKVNGGLSSARNEGIRLASGEYIYFLDSDDFIELHSMKTLYDSARSDDLDIVYFNGRSVYENQDLAEKYSTYDTYYQRKAPYHGIMTGQKLFAAMTPLSDFRPSVCLQFYKTKLIKDLNILFYKGIIHEDNLFSFLSAMQANRVQYLNQPLFVRRVRENSTMTKEESPKNLVGYFVCLAESINFIHGMSAGQEIQDAVNKHITNLFIHVRRIYQALSNEQKKSIDFGGNIYHQILFSLISKNTEFNSPSGNVAENLKKSIEESASFRIGRAITFVPRALLVLGRTIKKYGLSMTIRKIIQRFKQ
jgi:glycosyltransferase involved in cell wall biosynthesis